MGQISPPMRIILAVAVVFLAAWVLFLKPGGETDTASAPATPATTPAGAANNPDGPAANTGLGRAVQSSRGAAKDTEEAQKRAFGEGSNAPSATKSSPGNAAPATPAKPADPSAAALAKLPDWLGNNIDKKVVAILFTNDKASDDRRTRAALADAYKADGKVVTRSVSISRIARYRPVAEGVDVQQSPTLMVIDRDRHAQTLVGYSNLATINQAIVDALLATDKPVRRVAYLQKVQHECRSIHRHEVIGPSAGDGPKGYERNVNALIAALGSSLGTLRNASVPSAYKPLSRDVSRFLSSEIAVNRQIKSTAIKSRTVDDIKVRQAARSNDRLQSRTVLELNAVGVQACN